MDHFDMMDFRLFVQIARANSLRQGAAEACLSAPAASTRIANLEARTGTKLLVRSSKGVSLTPAGQAFFHHAQQVLGQVESLNVDLQEYARSLKGHLRIGANPMAMMESVPGALKAYLPQHEDVRLDLREMPSHDIVRALLAGSMDIGVVLSHVRTAELEAIEFNTTALVMVTPCDHPLAEADSVTFAELLEHAIVDFPDTSPTYGPLHLAAERSGVRMRTHARASTLDSLCSLVDAGVGVGVIPDGSAGAVTRYAGLHVVPISDPDAKVTSLICARRFKALPSYARNFVNALLEQEAAEPLPAQVQA